ncbi:MAG: hypothetical protein ACRC37_05870 [Lentisphaeria bacterium]
MCEARFCRVKKIESGGEYGVGAYKVNGMDNPGLQISFKRNGSELIGLFYNKDKQELTLARFRH